MFFEGGGGARLNGVSLPPSSGFALPACRPTELGFDSGGGSSVRDQNGHSPLLHSLPLWSTYVGEWTSPVLAHMLVIVSTYA